MTILKWSSHNGRRNFINCSIIFTFLFCFYLNRSIPEELLIRLSTHIRGLNIEQKDNCYKYDQIARPLFSVDNRLARFLDVYCIL